jgi:hypothetical protein
VLISALTASFLTGVQNNPPSPKDLASQAQMELAGGIPFLSDKDLQAQLDRAHVPAKTADARIAGLRCLHPWWLGGARRPATRHPGELAASAEMIARGSLDLRGNARRLRRHPAGR